MDAMKIKTLQSLICRRMNEEATQQVSKKGPSIKLAHLRLSVLFRALFCL